jgi:DNA sulfur modification protein DndB
MAIPEFSPLGLDDYLADEQRQFNTSSFAMISDIEQFFRTDIRESLERKYGTRWVKDGVPPKVVTDASARMIEKNLQLDPNEEVEMWDCLNLIQFQQVLQFKHEQWVDLFAEQYTRPEEVDTPGGWKTKTSWMTNLNDIRNKIAHDHFVKEVEYEFLTELHGWLIEGQMVSAI